MSEKDEPYHITVEVVNKQCKVMKMLKDSGIQQFQVIDLRSLDGDVTRHLVRIPSKHISRIPKDTSVKKRSNSKPEKEISAWIDSRGCDVCTSILSQTAFLISGSSIEEHTLVYNFIVPSFEAFKNTISALEGKNVKPKILEVAKFKPKGKILTQKQERVLWLALRMGFFEYPRKIHTAELSQRMKISMSTLSEIIRRGMRRLLENYFET